MRLSDRRKSEIRHLQEELAKRNKVIADLNKAATKLREDHSKDVEGFRAQIRELRAGLADASQASGVAT